VLRTLGVARRQKGSSSLNAPLEVNNTSRATSTAGIKVGGRAPNLNPTKASDVDQLCSVRG